MEEAQNGWRLKQVVVPFNEKLVFMVPGAIRLSLKGKHKQRQKA